MQDAWTTTHVTLEDALSHRAGQPGHDLSWQGPNKSLRDVVHKFRYLPPTAEIRTKWQYCNMMYMTVSYFIEKMTGVWLGHFLQTRIYDALNMSSTFFSLSDAKAAADTGRVSLAQGYAWVNSTESYQPLRYMDSPVVSGAGATISTVIDFTKWLRCLMTKSTPLSPAGHAALRYPRMTYTTVANEFTEISEFNLYSLGLDISFYRGELIVSHSGGLPGFKTLMAFLPNRQWGIVTMANTLESPADTILAFKLIDDLLGVPPLQRFDWGKRTEAALQQKLYTLRHAREINYPNVPNPPIPLTLPLSDYSGFYTHPAYPTINLTLNRANNRLFTLSCQHLNGEPIHISLSHVSGDFFLVWARAYVGTETKEDDWNPWTDFIVKGEFRIGESGKVTKMGINVEPQMGEQNIWWERSA
jgi:CubicO group peptidase (beta-lactamase class C family)